LPLDLAKKLPRYPLIPATLLGRLAVGREHHGQKLGSLLLMTLSSQLEEFGADCFGGVVAEAINESARKFYLHHEFVPILEHPGKLIIADGHNSEDVLLNSSDITASRRQFYSLGGDPHNAPVWKPARRLRSLPHCHQSGG